MKQSAVSTFFVATVLFTSLACGSYVAALRLSSRYQRSHLFSTFGVEEGQRLRRVTQILLAFETSRLTTKNSVDSLERNVVYVGELRDQAPEEVKPILELRLAIDHAVLSKLFEQANNRVDAATHKDRAQSLFRSLGWKDVSPQVLDELAQKQLQSRPK
ncbi:MAG: hypothetical protein JOZ44_14410 [Acidobacteria bacterium]|nr:hypothetical protein [Acidobacteriota bacterium]